MGKVAYWDQNTILGKCYITRSYDFLHDKILQESNTFTKVLHRSGEVYGYDITINQPLTELYHFPCYVIKFVFSKVETLHCQKQEDIMQELCTSLKKDIETGKGYYLLRIPTHIVDLIRAINQNSDGFIFCGGTVEEVHIGELKMSNRSHAIELFFADQQFVKEHRNRLISMAFDSFQSYQGQYHISPITSEDAGKIYCRWIESTLQNFKENTIMIARHNQEIAGYYTVYEDSIAVEGVLTSVNSEKRALGIYKAMISRLIQYAKEKEKLFITSTQFDNYIAQGTCNSLGLRPFYSIYNMHFDNR